MSDPTENWIELDRSEIAPDANPADSRAYVRYFPSAYNLPTGVRVHFERDGKRCVLEFRYLDGDEPVICRGDMSGIRYALGKNSQRLFGVWIDGVVDRNELFKTVVSAIAGRKHDANPGHVDNFEATNRVLSHVGDRLFPRP
jgi:hypothetical protein